MGRRQLHLYDQNKTSVQLVLQVMHMSVFRKSADLCELQFLELGAEVVRPIGLGLGVAADAAQEGGRQLQASGSLLLGCSRLLLPH